MTSPADYLAAAARTALAGSGSFFHERGEQVTLALDAAPLPAIVLYDYSTSQANPAARVESAACTLYFSTSRPGQGDDPAAGNLAVTQMMALKSKFLTALDAALLAQVDGLKATAFYNAFAAELDGVGCQFVLTVPAVPLVPVCVVAVPTTQTVTAFSAVPS